LSLLKGEERRDESFLAAKDRAQSVYLWFSVGVEGAKKKSTARWRGANAMDGHIKVGMGTVGSWGSNSSRLYPKGQGNSGRRRDSWEAHSQVEVKFRQVSAEGGKGVCARNHHHRGEAPRDQKLILRGRERISSGKKPRSKRLTPSIRESQRGSVFSGKSRSTFHEPRRNLRPGGMISREKGAGQGT